MDLLSRISKKYAILFVIILAFALRFFWIEKSPPSLNWDETALGYNAYSILKTGNDEWGNKLPLFLRSFDDYKPAIYAYITTPFVHFLGLTPTSVRLPSVIAGTISVLLIYLITKILFGESTALVSSLLFAIEPWSIHFSRTAFESNLALTFYLGGVYFLIKSKLNSTYSYLGILSLSLSAYTYHAEKIIIVPTVLIFLVIYRKMAVSIILVTVIFLFPTIIYQIFHMETFSRLGSTFLIKYPAERYLSYFSPINLFVRGTSEPTQHVPKLGMFYNIEFFFWIIGIFLIFKNFKKEKLLPLLIFISPIPAVITFNWFYPARVLPLFAFYSIVIAVGIITTFKYLENKSRFIWFSALVVTTFFFLYLTSNLAMNLLFYLPYQERGNWQYGMENMVNKISKVQENYNQVVIETKTAQPYIFLLFYSKYRPDIYQKQIGSIKNISPRKSFDFGKYQFRDVYWDKDKDLRSTLLVGPDSSLPMAKVKANPNVNLIFDVNDSDGNLLYRVVGIK